MFIRLSICSVCVIVYLVYFLPQKVNGQAHSTSVQHIFLVY